MTAGVRYTFQLTGCLGSGTSLCGSDTADIILMDSPLRVAITGGDFATGTTSGFTIDACEESGDPDDFGGEAELEWAWRGPYAVLADGELAVNASIAPPQRNQSGCSWEIEAGALPAGEYVIIVNGSRLTAGDTPTLDSAEDSVRVTLQAPPAGTSPGAVLHSVAITPLVSEKINPGARLNLVGVFTEGAPFNVTLLDQNGTAGEYTVNPDLESVTFAWSMTGPSAFNLSDPALSRDGNTLLSFFLVPDILNQGSTYTFELHATVSVHAPNTTNSSWSFSTFGAVQVTVNRAPFGGDLLVTHGDLLVALESPIELEAREWTDDPEDMPLEYTFMRSNAELYRSSAYLGQRSQAKRTTWLYPSPGAWLLSANVYDTYGAYAETSNPTGNVFVQPALRVSSEALTPLVAMAESFVATGDGAAVSQIIAAAAETLNQGTGFGGFGESVAAEMIDTRALLADLLCQVSTSAACFIGIDPTLPTNH